MWIFAFHIICCMMEGSRKLYTRYHLVVVW